jgi:hypothetical protein
VAQGERILAMNLAVLKKTRGRPAPGDIFAMLPPDGLYLYGRVIATDANAGGFEGANLIYVYRARSKEKTAIPELLRAQLLLPPLMTNNLPWTKGYLEVVKNESLGQLERLPQHCFCDVRGWYFDEKGSRLARPTEPVGVFGLHSFRSIDDEISRALGIEPAPPDT